MFTLSGFYGLLILTQLTALTVFLRNINDISDALIAYLFCSLGGDKEECISLGERRFNYVTPPLVMDWIAFILEMLTSVINLNFLITYTDVKNVVAWLSHRLRRTNQ